MSTFNLLGLLVLCLLPLVIGSVVAFTVWVSRRLGFPAFREPSAPALGCRYQIIAAFLLSLGVLGAFCFILSLVNGVTFALYAVPAQATVVDHRIRTQMDDQDIRSCYCLVYYYYLTYQFTPATSNNDATPLTEEEEVTSDVYYGLPLGSTVTIHYLPSNPRMSRLGRQPVLERGALVVMLLLFVSVTFLLAFATFRPVIAGWRQSTQTK